MLWNSLIKKPVLVIGVIMVIALFIDIYRRQEGKSLFYREDFIANSCRAVLVKLEKRTPANWKTYCEDNNLTAEMNYSGPDIGHKDSKQIAYRRLANDLSFISKNSPNETLDRVYIVRIKSSQPGLEINAVTEGKHISKLAGMNSPSHISEHLKNTVQVKEVIK